MRRVLQLGIAVALSSAALADAPKDAKEALRVRQIAAAYAKCVIAQSTGQARRYVIDDKQAPIAGECLVKATKGMGGQMTFPGQTYRYALAEALLIHDFPTGAPASVKDAPPAVFKKPEPLDEAKLPKNPKKATAMREAHDRWQAQYVMNLLGDCAARIDPVAVFALAHTEVGSAAERAAFETLKPSIGECLPPGATLHFGAAALRGSLAVGLYRLANSMGMPAHA